MQFIAAASLIAAVAAMPTTLAPRADILFDIQKFTAACVPHSAMCNYSFDVLQVGNGETVPVSCSKQVLGGNGALPAVTDGTCVNSTRTWTVAENTDGSYKFVVTQQVSRLSYASGTYTIPADEIVMQQTGASAQESYTGPQEFEMERVV